MKKNILLFFLIISPIIFAQQTKFQKIDSLLSYLNTNNKFMGSIALRENDKIVFAKGYGYADVKSNKKLETETKLKIGSITKTFTAVMIMQLVDENKLSLDTKLSKFYPNIKNADKITIETLLYQRSGIIDYLNDDSSIATEIYKKNKKEAVIKRIETYKSDFEPNIKHDYSNSNYFILGCILEKITKKSFAENVSKRIASKAKLINTYYKEELLDSSKNEALSYFYNQTWEKFNEINPTILFSSGGILSTPTDQTLFFEALFNNKLVSKTGVAKMIEMKDKYGAALVKIPFDEKIFYGHNGKIDGYLATTGYNIEDKFGISLLLNAVNFNQNDIMIGVLSLYYDRPYVFPNLINFAVGKEVVSKYVGTYSAPTFPMKITITEENGELKAQATGQSAFTLNATSETEFEFMAAGIKIIFADNQLTLKQGAEYILKKE